MDTKEVFKEFNPKLVQSLPLKDTHFLAELTQQNLFYGNLKEVVMAAPTRADAATQFLYEVVERSLDVENREPFEKLLLVMEKFGDPTLNRLAKEIKQKVPTRVGEV